MSSKKVRKKVEEKRKKIRTQASGTAGSKKKRLTPYEVYLKILEDPSYVFWADKKNSK